MTVIRLPPMAAQPPAKSKTTMPAIKPHQGQPTIAVAPVASATRRKANRACVYLSVHAATTYVKARKVVMTVIGSVATAAMRFANLKTASFAPPTKCAQAACATRHLKYASLQTNAATAHSKLTRVVTMAIPLRAMAARCCAASKLANLVDQVAVPVASPVCAIPWAMPHRVCANQQRPAAMAASKLTKRATTATPSTAMHATAVVVAACAPSKPNAAPAPTASWNKHQAAASRPSRLARHAARISNAKARTASRPNARPISNTASLAAAATPTIVVAAHPGQSR